MKQYDLKRSNQSWLKVIVICLITSLVIIVGVIFTVRRVYTQNLQPVSASQRNIVVTIPSGASVQEISSILKEAGVIKKAWAFEWYIRNNNLRNKLQAGTYYLRPNQSVQEITEVISGGKVATDLVTILPAQRLDQIKQKLINSGFTTKSVEAALNPELYKDHPALVDKPTGANLEGYLYPESFQKTATTKPETIIRASLDEMQKHLTPELRAGIFAQGLTVHQGVILASVIEQEVGNPADKPKVSQVFLKRLKSGIALESDPTIIYGAIIDGQKPSLTYNSAYNTYKNKGLMPGPISNVSATSLQAVVNPAKTDYLFFVAGDDGVTYFSKTLAEHEALTAQHCKKLCG